VQPVPRGDAGPAGVATNTATGLQVVMVSIDQAGACEQARQFMAAYFGVHFTVLLRSGGHRVAGSHHGRRPGDLPDRCRRQLIRARCRLCRRARHLRSRALFQRHRVRARRHHRGAHPVSPRATWRHRGRAPPRYGAVT
jgi:hypothetical protein